MHWLILAAWLAVSTAYLSDGVLLIATLGDRQEWGQRQLTLAAPLLFTVLTFLLTPWRLWGLAAIAGAIAVHLIGHAAAAAALRRRTVPADGAVLEQVSADGFHEVRIGEAGPAVVGLWRQTLVLPPAALALSADDLGGIVAHERAHAQSHDSLKLWLASIAGTLLCWHPLARFNLAALRLQVELGADLRAAAAVGDVRRYACTLGRWGLARSGQKLPGWGAALAERESELLIRLELLTEPGPPVRQVRAPLWLRQALSRRHKGPRMVDGRAATWIAAALPVWTLLGYLALLLVALRFA